jgi:hypothetical protein
MGVSFEHEPRVTGPRCVLAAVVTACLAAGCRPAPGQQLCEAIARRDVAAVGRVFAEHDLDPLERQRACLPAEAVFVAAGPKDAALTAIGIELIKAGLPAEASWVPSGGGSRVTAIEVAAGKGNVELVRALLAVGLDVKAPEVERALIRAAERGHLPVVTLLAQEGAALDATEGGLRADERAEQNGHEAVARFLVDTATARAAAAAAAEAKPEP